MLLPTRRVLLAAPALALPFTAAAREPGGPLIAPIRLEGRRVLVGVTLAGRGPYDFIIDTGAVVSGILDSLAVQLRLRALPKTRLRGGGGENNFPLYEATEVVVGNAFRQDSVVFFGMERIGTAGTGLLAGTLTKVDADLDFRAGELRLYPQGRRERTGFTRLASSIRATPRTAGAPKILVDIELDGVSRRMVVDTGHPGLLSLGPEAARASGLWNDAKPYAPTPLIGISGTERLHGRVVRAASLKVGPTVIEAPLVALHDPRMGKDMPGADGIIGLALLQQFDLSTDIDGKALWVRPNGLAAPPNDYRRSGLWLDEAGQRIVIAEVSPGSPAAEGGIRVGDRLAAGAVLKDVVRELSRPAGSTLVLNLERDGKTFAATLTLRDYL